MNPDRRLNATMMNGVRRVVLATGSVVGLRVSSAAPDRLLVPWISRNMAMIFPEKSMLTIYIFKSEY
jgi:hypothetical protein